MFISIFVSQPVAESIGQVVVLALEIVNSFTAEAVSTNFINSLLKFVFVIAHQVHISPVIDAALFTPNCQFTTADVTTFN